MNCDTWMNVHLREVICTAKDGDRFWRMPECYIRGNTVKYMRVQEEVLDKAVEEQKKWRRHGQGRGECTCTSRRVASRHVSFCRLLLRREGNKNRAFSSTLLTSLSLSLSLSVCVCVRVCLLGFFFVSSLGRWSRRPRGPRWWKGGLR